MSPTEPGYAAVRIAPRPGGTLAWARTALDSRHGRIEVAGRVGGDELVVETTVPDGVRAVLTLPGLADEAIHAGSSSHRSPLPAR